MSRNQETSKRSKRSRTNLSPSRPSGGGVTKHTPPRRNRPFARIYTPARELELLDLNRTMAPSSDAPPIRAAVENDQSLHDSSSIIEEDSSDSSLTESTHLLSSSVSGSESAALISSSVSSSSSMDADPSFIDSPKEERMFYVTYTHLGYNQVL